MARSGLANRQPYAARVRNRLLGIGALLTAIGVLISFLLLYPGFYDWRQIDDNLTIFVAVHVTIVLLATTFYLILRNLLKLLHERKDPLAAVGLKRKLMIAFLGMSLPAVGFHLLLGGLTGNVFRGFHREALFEGLTQLKTTTAWLQTDEQARVQAQGMAWAAALPASPQAYREGGNLPSFPEDFGGALQVRDEQGVVLGRWQGIGAGGSVSGWVLPGLPGESSSASVLGSAGVPAPLEEERLPIRALETKEGRFWQLWLPLPRGVLSGGAEAIPLYLEMWQPFSVRLQGALGALAVQTQNIERALEEPYWLALGTLLMLTLLAITAGIWMAVYLARGFVRPLEQLAEATQQVAEGAPGVQVDTGQLGPLAGDFKALVEAFNAMSRQLSVQQAQVQKATLELRASHRALGERNQLVELLLENLAVGVLFLDAQGRVLSLNRAAKRFLRIQEAPPHLLRTHYSGLLGKKQAAILKDLLGEWLGHPGPEMTRNVGFDHAHPALLLEVQLITLERSPATSPADSSVASDAVEVRRVPQTLGVLILLRDVTSVQRTQRALAWREVARRVAHEIKNPLTPIQLSAQRIRRKYGELERRVLTLEGGAELESHRRSERNGGVASAPAKAAPRPVSRAAAREPFTPDPSLYQNIDTIIQEVGSIKQLVNEFALLARLPESHPVSDDLNQVIEEIAPLYQGALPENVTLRLALAAEVPPCLVDRSQLKRVFSNLIDNAIAALGDEGGEVRVSTGYQAARGLITARVADNGRGVDEARRGHLFEPYATTKRGGSGLGLAIARQIVSDHQGVIRYEEGRPCGSVFVLEFPLASHGRAAVPSEETKTIRA